MSGFLLGGVALEIGWDTDQYGESALYTRAASGFGMSGGVGLVMEEILPGSNGVPLTLDMMAGHDNNTQLWMYSHSQSTELRSLKKSDPSLGNVSESSGFNLFDVAHPSVSKQFGTSWHPFLKESNDDTIEEPVADESPN